MLTIENNLQTEVVGSEDGKYTYEVRRSWGNGGKALVIELYPAVSAKKSGCWDLSAMHLINHADELGWGEVRIINLYSKVFSSKPSVKELKSDVENTAYIRAIFEEEAVKDYDIVIAWGSSLETHLGTIHAKAELLDMLKEKGLENQVKHIITDRLDTNGQRGTHPLYLGLRYAKETWKLQPYPLEKALEELKNNIPKKQEKNLPNAEKTADSDREEKRETPDQTNRIEAKPKKGRKKDVLPNKKPA